MQYYKFLIVFSLQSFYTESGALSGSFLFCGKKLVYSKKEIHTRDLIMTAYLLLPFLFLKFWFIDAPIALIRYFFTYNGTFLAFISLPLYLRTFFKPLKNEYRPGLVGFSIAMGIGMKTILIAVDMLLFALLLIVEFLVILGFLFIPFGTVYLLLI